MDASALERRASEHDPSDSEDMQKIEAFLAGDKRAFEFLFDKYRDRVFRIAYRFVRNKEDALEIAQDVFLRVFLNLSKFKTDSKFFTWLYRVTVNRSIDFMRLRKARPASGVDPTILQEQPAKPTSQGGDRDPSQLAQEKDLDEKLAEAVRTLSEKHRAVFLLHAMENLSYKEIARVVGCSIGTVMSRLFYARKKLQEKLGKYGLERPGRKPRESAVEFRGGKGE